MVRVATVSGEQIEASVDELASALLIAKPGQKLVYATDFADTEANVEALVELARGADAMVCEASFLNEDAEQARLTRHLTTGACARIAQAAGVGLLIPFHPSVRYEDRAQQVWREVSEGFGRVYVPPQLRW
jgi:ribonuclease BN (tRNA processing enzyme)